jgi:Ni,Fe-hydrogenase III large subunit/Ni,Fe-hydrogenase III component G
MNEIENILTALKEKFPTKITDIKEKVHAKFYLTVDKSAVVEVINFLKENSVRYITSVGVDLREKGNGFLVNHIMSLDAAKTFFLLKTFLDADKPIIKSITPIIPGAHWAELEFQDLFGIKLEGHPKSRRLVLPENWPENVYPLRRDIPHNYKPPMNENIKLDIDKPLEGQTTIPIGPFFPVLEEPYFLKLFVSGENIMNCDSRGFFNHRGIEKLADSKLTYNEIPFVAERICGICGFIHSTAYVEAVEEAGGIKVPRRARYIRTILLELERIHSHLLWLGIAGHIIGFDTVLMQSWRIREPIMWACERITGNRKTYGQNLVGGVRRDITDEVKPEIFGVLDKIEKGTKEVVDAIVNDSTLHARLKNVGILSKEMAQEYCVVGPTARGSGIPIDSRIDHPYSAYDEIVPQIVVFDGCDNWSRVLVRLHETFESIRLVRKAINELPDGPIMANINEKITPMREGVTVVEAPRGESIHYVISGDDYRPYRWKVRAPSYQHLQALPTMIKNAKVADVPITLGSLDPCFSCTERMEIIDTKTNEIQFFSSDEISKLSRFK